MKLSKEEKNRLRAETLAYAKSLTVNELRAEIKAGYKRLGEPEVGDFTSEMIKVYEGVLTQRGSPRRKGDHQAR